MQALSEAGVPIIGSPGQGYSLSEGYFLPPVSLTSEEAVTLLLGLEFIDQQFDAQYQAKAREARSKIEAVLSDKVRKEADRTCAGVRLQAANPDQALCRDNGRIACGREAEQTGSVWLCENVRQTEKPMSLLPAPSIPMVCCFGTECGCWWRTAICGNRSAIFC